MIDNILKEKLNKYEHVSYLFVDLPKTKSLEQESKEEPKKELNEEKEAK